MKIYIRSNANTYLGGNSELPTKADIISGNATYGGLPIEYYPNMTAEARNMDHLIWVSDKFFNLDPATQKHVLNHEVAHDYSDMLMKEHTGDWNDFCSVFITEKAYPPTSTGYKQGKRTYWEGLYSDIGATALSETLTHAICEYFDDPNRLRSRSSIAYNVIDEFIKRKLL